LKVRRASTEFNVRSGQTLVLGGFISREQSQNTEGIPGLSDIPVLGHLFGAHRTHRAQTELAIFVTPIVVDANNGDLAKRKSIANDLLRENFPEPLQLNGQIRQDARSTEQSIFEGQWGDDLDKKPGASVVNQWE
jgi:pilus assembly protein CpaC